MKTNTKKTSAYVCFAEFMIVATIFLLLATIAIPAFQDAREKQKYRNIHRNDLVSVSQPESPNQSQSDLIAEQNRLLRTLIEQNNRR